MSKTLPSDAVRKARTSVGPVKFLALALAGLTSFASVTTMTSASVAAFSAKDGQVLGRTLGFVGDGMSGIVVVGVVASNADPASRQNAEAIRDVIGADLPAGRVHLRFRLVTIEQLASLSGVDALYVTTGVAGSMDRIAGTAQRLHVPTISADLGCVQSRGCVIGYSTEPTVQIVIDKDAAERCGVRFMQAFRMLVREQ